jgi:hypothetical protein
MRFLRSKRGLAGVGALAAVLGITLFVVLPAVASNPGDKVPPPSAPGNITPTDVAIGGNGVCANIFPKLWARGDVKEYDNVNPLSTANFVPSGNPDTATFKLTLSGTNQAQLLQVESTNAAIFAMGIKGGNDTAAYDYLGSDYSSPTTGPAQKWVTTDGTLHAPASKLSRSGDPTQWYGISLLNVCYRLVAPITGRVFNDANGSGSSSQTGIAATNEVTIVDTTTGGTTTVNTGANGSFSSSQPIGDTYTVCAKFPSGFGTQTVPTSGYSCPSGYAPLGYTFTLTSSGSSGNNFGFQSLRTISGQIYNDSNLNGDYDPSGTLLPHDSALGAGWTIKLYDTTSSTFGNSGTSASNGTYSFTAAIASGDSYKLCALPPSGDTTTWVQTEPRPTGSSPTCDDVTSALHWGAGFTGGTSDVSQDFGNHAGNNCTSNEAMGSGDILALMPADSNGDCVKPNTFAFASGTDPSNDNKQYVGIAVGDPTQATEWAPVVEKITFTDPLQTNGTPTYTGLEYIAGSVTTVTAMQSCTVAAGTLLDPDNGADYGGQNAAISDLYLAHDYTGLRTTGSGAPVLPTGQTACLIKIDITGESGGTGTLVAYVYSPADSITYPH